MMCVCTPFESSEFACPVHGPCQGCWYVTGFMMPHDGTCDGITEQNFEQMRADWAAAHAQDQVRP